MRRTGLIFVVLAALGCHQVSLLEPPPIEEGEAMILFGASGLERPLAYGIARPNQRLPAIPHGEDFELWAAKYACPLEHLDIATGALELVDDPDPPLPMSTETLRSSGGPWTAATPTEEAAQIISRIQMGDYCSQSQAQFEEILHGGTVSEDGTGSTAFVIPLGGGDVLGGLHMYGEVGIAFSKVIRGTLLLRFRDLGDETYTVDEPLPLLEDFAAGGFAALEAPGGPRWFVVGRMGVAEWTSDGQLNVLGGATELGPFTRFAADGSPDGSELFIVADGFEPYSVEPTFPTALFRFDGATLETLFRGAVEKERDQSEGEVLPDVGWLEPGQAAAIRLGSSLQGDLNGYLHVTTATVEHRGVPNTFPINVFSQGDKPAIIGGTRARSAVYRNGQFRSLPYLGDRLDAEDQADLGLDVAFEWGGSIVMMGRVPRNDFLQPSRWQFLYGLSDVCNETESQVARAIAGARIDGDRRFIMRESANTREISFAVLQRKSAPNYCDP